MAYSSIRNEIALEHGAAYGRVQVLDARNGKTLRTLEVPDLGIGHVEDLTYSSDGKLLLYGWENDAVLWDLESLEFKRLRGHTGTVQTVAFHPSGKFFATGSDDRGIRIWDVQSGDQISHELHYHKRRVLSLRFSRDGKIMISSDAEGCTALWNSKTLKHLYDLDRLPAGVTLDKNWIGPRLFRFNSSMVFMDKIGP